MSEGGGEVVTIGISNLCKGQDLRTLSVGGKDKVSHEISFQRSHPRSIFIT